MRKLAILGVALALTACATTPTGLSPAQLVYAAEGSLTTAMQVATSYAQLPTCGAGQPVICSDPGTVARIKAAAPAAVAAVSAAQAVVTSGSASASAKATAAADATQAVGSLTQLTATVKIR